MSDEVRPREEERTEDELARATGEPRGGAESAARDAASPLPSLPVRLVQTVVSPGKMSEAVAAHPRWIGALLVCAVLFALSQALIPMELLEEMQRRVALRSGRPVPEIPESARTVIRVVSIVAPAVAFILMSFVMAGINTFIYAFVLGDEGAYKQYLAIGVHAAVITALAQVLLAPARIAAEDPQLTINLGTFLLFLPEGFISNVFRMADVSQIWASLVVAMGAHAIDRRRSFASAAAIQMAIVLVVALAFGWFITRQGM